MESNDKLGKIAMQDVVNLSQFESYRSYLECYLCKYLAMNPYYCEKCKNSFCENCISTLNLESSNKCPVCLAEDNSELRVSNERFYDFFKDLLIQCDQCNEKVPYPLAKFHKCFLLPKVHNPEAHSDKKIIVSDNIIYVLCEKCGAYIQSTRKETHDYSCNPQNVNLPLINGSNCPFCVKPVLGNNFISHLFDCADFIKKLVLTDKFKAIWSDLIKTDFSGISDLQNLRISKETFEPHSLVKSIASLENCIKSGIYQNDDKSVSYCRKCHKVYKNKNLVTCKCCDRKFCENCLVPCIKCDSIVSNDCFFLCQGCHNKTCPLCEIKSTDLCFCLEHKFCKKCFNNPNINNLSLALMKGNHSNCAFIKQLDLNVFICKIPEFDFKVELSMNSIKQIISLSFVKNGKDVLSKLFQINVNDKLVIEKQANYNKIISSVDSWNVDLSPFAGANYLIINFNVNPNYTAVLTKLNISNFETLPSAGGIGVTGLGGMFNVGKSVIGNINFQKITNIE
jgi:hypothetical protein